MDVLSEIGRWKPWAAFASLSVLLLLEWWVPFRISLQPKLRHMVTNCVIAGGNAAIVNVLFGAVLLAWSHRADREGWGLLHYVGLGPVADIVAAVVVLDLVFYGVHWANHQVPFLWRFHHAHHSDLDLDATSALRFHLGEVLISTGIKAISIPVLGISPAGLLIFEMALQAAAQFQHSNIRLPEGGETWVRRVIVTPHMHWLHHSHCPQDHNANYGTILSMWDRMLGTYSMRIPRNEIRIGLDEYPLPKDVGLFSFYLMPFGRARRSGRDCL
jgi:sterol desaturase/sphingolipid hydroxylase (fatty acid hydroxylase superfamily)